MLRLLKAASQNTGPLVASPWRLFRLPACHLDVSHRLELLVVVSFKALIGLASVRRKPRA